LENLCAAKESLDHTSRDLVRIYARKSVFGQRVEKGFNTDVGSRSSVLKVSVAILGTLTGDSDRSATVGDTRGEGIDVAGFVTTGETLLIIGTVDGDVLLVLLL